MVKRTKKVPIICNGELIDSPIEKANTGCANGKKNVYISEAYEVNKGVKEKLKGVNKEKIVDKTGDGEGNEMCMSGGLFDSNLTKKKNHEIAKYVALQQEKFLGDSNKQAEMIKAAQVNRMKMLKNQKLQMISNSKVLVFLFLKRKKTGKVDPIGYSSYNSYNTKPLATKTPNGRAPVGDSENRVWNSGQPNSKNS